MFFISPTKGRLNLEQVFQDIISFVRSGPGARYKMIIGTDSHARSETCFVTAVVIHKVGKGGRYYYRKKTHRKITSLRQKIFFETSLSLETAGKLAAKLAEQGMDELDVEIHLDIGANGDTKDLIREIVGMVVGSGFGAKIKPNSYGASKVADKHTK
ncbi:MAG: ribonuclease H-like YkuK family protein [Bacillota bacterium]